MLVAAFLDLSEVDVYFLHFQFLFFAEDAHHLQLLAEPDDGDVSILQIDHTVGVFDDGAGIRTNEELVVADAHHQRTLLAGGDDLTRVALVDDGDGVGSDDLIECHLHGLEQRELLLGHDVLHQLHQHFRIGVALELDAFRL